MVVAVILLWFVFVFDGGRFCFCLCKQCCSKFGASILLRWCFHFSGPDSLPTCGFARWKAMYIFLLVNIIDIRLLPNVWKCPLLPRCYCPFNKPFFPLPLCPLKNVLLDISYCQESERLLKYILDICTSPMNCLRFVHFFTKKKNLRKKIWVNNWIIIEYRDLLKQHRKTVSYKEKNLLGMQLILKQCRGQSCQLPAQPKIQVSFLTPPRI